MRDKKVSRRGVCCTHLNSNHHAEMALRVLLDHVTHIVRLPRLLELSSRHEIFNLPDRPDGIAMGFG
jgi:hypothetical protein